MAANERRPTRARPLRGDRAAYGPRPPPLAPEYPAARLLPGAVHPGRSPGDQEEVLAAFSALRGLRFPRFSDPTRPSSPADGNPVYSLTAGTVKSGLGTR